MCRAEDTWHYSYFFLHWKKKWIKNRKRESIKIGRILQCGLRQWDKRSERLILSHHCRMQSHLANCLNSCFFLLQTPYINSLPLLSSLTLSCFTHITSSIYTLSSLSIHGCWNTQRRSPKRLLGARWRWQSQENRLVFFVFFVFASFCSFHRFTEIYVQCVFVLMSCETNASVIRQKRELKNRVFHVLDPSDAAFLILIRTGFCD